VPSLSKEERVQLLGPVSARCGRCDWQLVRNYCRSCDVFVMSCDCGLDERQHRGHRLYVWTWLGVVAIPNFDDL
jgi:hypothetical protein